MGDAAMIQLNTPTDEAYGFKLGDIVEQNGTEYMYVKSAAAMVAGQFVLINPVTNVAAASLTADAGVVRAVGCALFEFTAADQFGWVIIKGLFTGNTATSLTAGQQIFTSATAGRAGATGGGAVLIQGASVVANTSSAGLNACYAVDRMRVN